MFLLKRVFKDLNRYLMLWNNYNYIILPGSAEFCIEKQKKIAIFFQMIIELLFFQDCFFMHI